MTAAISVAGLVKNFGTTRALDHLDLTVSAGEVHGFLGPNGAGKTTTIRILLGLLRRDGGEVSVLGGDPWRDTVSLHHRLAYVPGEVNLWPNLTGGEVIDLLGSLRGGFDRSRRADLLNRFALDPTKRCRAYSKGNRQKVALVAAFASDVELYLLDEPTSGLDPLMEAVFQDVVRELRGAGRAVLLSSHILSEVEALCDRVTYPPRAANARAVSTVSVYPTTSTPAAGSSNCRRSSRSGRAGAGRPCGIGPTTLMPWLCRSNPTTARVASSTASSGTGRAGRRHCPISRKASTAAANSSVPTFNWGRCRTKEARWPAKVSPVTGTPVSLPSWPTTMIMATPARYPTRIGLDSRSATNPSRVAKASRHISPTTTASAAARAAYRAGCPPASGATTTAVISAVVDSGPTDSWRDEPTSAYSASGARIAHRPVTGGSPASAP